MEFEGVYPAIITPLDNENNFKEDEFRKIVEFNINSGAHGFWVSGYPRKTTSLSPKTLPAFNCSVYLILASFSGLKFLSSVPLLPSVHKT